MPGLFIVGDLAGAPVVKLAMEQGHQVAGHIARLPRTGGDPLPYDVLILGAGAAGLNAALTLHQKGLRVLVLEKNRIANTIEDFPEGKWIYAEPASLPAAGLLWLEGASKEQLLRHWHAQIREHNLAIKTGAGVTAVERRREGGFLVRTEAGEFRSRWVVLATGQRGNPRLLQVPGEEQAHVQHRLYSPRHYRDEDIVVAGGGNSAVEAALVLSEHNRVTLCHRGREFDRLFKDNARQLQQAEQAGQLTVLRQAQVRRFQAGSCEIEQEQAGQRTTRTLPCQHAFVLIGADAPVTFLRALGVRLENDWTGSPWLPLLLVIAAFAGLALFQGQWHTQAWAGLALTAASLGTLAAAGLRHNRFAWLGFSFVLCYSIYAVKQWDGGEFWPYRGWGYKLFSFGGRSWSFWYTVLYTAAMTLFGIQAMKRWAIDRKDRFQFWRYVSLISFQWIFFFLIPEFLFRWAVDHQWLGARLAQDPGFLNNTWRSYGLVYAWPLFFNTFLNHPDRIWVVWGLLLSFVLLPLLVLFHGKRYCSWICGCGGLAETLGDRWRHLAPKGHTSIAWERMNMAVLAFAAGATLLGVGKDVWGLFQPQADWSTGWYHLAVDTWLVGILPVTLYPFFGGKIWCRYWCPLAKMMEVWSRWFTRFRASRFAIHANDKCIACGECTRQCQVGIHVMQYAMQQRELNNANSSCIGCGICVTVCPMDVLSFAPQAKGETALVQIASKM